MNLVLIFGGDSTEHDISVISGVEALNALPVRGIKAMPLYLCREKWYTSRKLYDVRYFCAFRPEECEEVRLAGRQVLKKGRMGNWKACFDIDCALLATHGGEGENGALQGFLEINNIPYTSSDVCASALCMDKLWTKLALRALDIPVVEGVGVHTADPNELDALEKQLGYPMIVKPASQGSSIGITMAHDRQKLEEGVRLALSFGKSALVERGLSHFMELNIAAFRMKGKLVLSEIERPLTAGDFLSFGDKYMSNAKGAGLTGREFPAKLEEDVAERIRWVASRAYEGLGLFGVVRMDFMKSEEGVFLNEINTIPGSLAHYLFPSFSYPALLRAMAEEGAKRGVNKPAPFPSQVLQRISLDGSVKHK